MMLTPEMLGCRGLQRQSSGSRPSPFSRRHQRNEPSGSTIGHDLRSAPAGTTIPAAGLGVDLGGNEADRTTPLTGQIASPRKVDHDTKAVAGIPPAPEQ
jgi:hypothetical protein